MAGAADVGSRFLISLAQKVLMPTSSQIRVTGVARGSRKGKACSGKVSHGHVVCHLKSFGPLRKALLGGFFGGKLLVFREGGDQADASDKECQIPPNETLSRAARLMKTPT